MTFKSIHDYFVGFFGKEARKPATFAEFFLHTSEEDKMKVFMRAAQKSNEDQQETFERAKALLRS